MFYSKIYPMSIVDGEGCRVSLFVSGCRNHCKECFNPETWDFKYGNEFTDIEVNEIITECNRKYISGLTILGGEPFEEENQKDILPLIKAFKEKCHGKNLWMFTGYVLDKDLLEGQRKHIDGVTDEILKNVDMLVDGPFINELKDLTLKFRGSSNQRLLSRDDIFKIMHEHTLK